MCHERRPKNIQNIFNPVTGSVTPACYIPLEWCKNPIYKEEIMTGQIADQDYQEIFEYHGNTAIERTRLHKGAVEREWIYFDSAEEAVEFFYEMCA